MAETRTYNGYTYSRNSAGEPWQLVGPAQQQPQSITIGRPDPYKATAEQRAQEDQGFQREQLRIAQEAERRSSAALAAQIANQNKPPEGFQRNADGTLSFIPGGPADPALKGDAAKPKTDEDKASIRAEAIDKIKLARSLIDRSKKGWLTTGIGAGLAGSIGGTAAYDVKQDTETLKNAGALTRIMEMAVTNGGKNPLTPLSNSDFQALASSLSNLDTSQSDTQFQANVQRVIDLYERAYGAAGGVDIEGDIDPTKRKGAVPGAGKGNGNAPPPSTRGYENDPTGGRTFQSDLDRTYQNEVETAFKAGATREQLDAIAAKYNAPAFGPDLDQALQLRQANPAAPVGFTTPATGREEAGLAASLGSMVGGISDEGWRGNVGSYFAGAGNAITAGNLGRIAELTGSSEGGTDLAMQMARDNGGAYFGGELTGGVLGALGTQGILGKVAGRMAPGAAANVLANPLTADTIYGAATGASTADDPLYGALGGAALGAGGSYAGQRIGQSLFGLGKPKGVDPLNRGERDVLGAVNATGASDIEAALLQAQELGVPASLADVSPEALALAGSSIRANPTIAGQARQTLQQRSRGQIDRFRQAVGRDLGPVENIPQRSEDLIAQAKVAAGPLYDAAYAAPGMEDLSIADLLARPSMTRAMGKARSLAMEEGRDPYTLGFVLNDGGDVTVPQLGRYVEARGERPPSPMSVISGQGNSAPADLLTFIRRNGGLRDTGGELGFMGINNAGRKGVPMAGRDASIGRLVNPETGRSFDEMAEAAWEAGYFGPVASTPRPTEREFLDALDDTYRGTGRTFSVNDEDVVNQYNDYQRMADEWNAAEGVMEDRSIPAGDSAPFAPMDAFGSVEEIAPTWQTIDYLKRGLDDVVQSNRSANMGRLDTEGRAVNDTLAQLLARADEMNQDYAAARAAYAGPMQERGFLEAGQEAVRANPNQLGVDMAGLTPQRAEQMRMGFTSQVVDDAERLRMSGNPFSALDTPAMEQRLGTVFNDPEAIARLLAQRDLEGQLSASTNRLVGNSMTAERAAGDAAFNDEGVMRPMIEAGAETAITGAPIMTILRNLANSGLGQRLTAGSRARAATRAEQIAPLTLNTNPEDTIAQILALAEKEAAYKAAKAAMAQRGSRPGALVGTGAATGLLPYAMGQ